MLVVNRFEVTESSAQQWRDNAKAALTALSACRGFVRGRFGGSLDDAGLALLVTEWESVGDYRRALSSFDVKMYATGLLAQAMPEASAFEAVLSVEDGTLSEIESDRAAGWGARPTESAVDMPDPTDNEV